MPALLAPEMPQRSARISKVDFVYCAMSKLQAS
jgi:hypothetical protein